MQTFLMFVGFALFLTGLFAGLHQWFVGRLADSDRKEYERRIKRLADQHRGYWKGERVIRQEDGTPLMYVRSAGR